MTETTSTKPQNCLNCNHAIQIEEKFCAHCGQKQTDGRVRFFSLVKDFVGDSFSFDSRLAKSIFPLIFKPGELTNRYFLGKHKSYVSPVRLFLFSIIFFFGIVAIILNQEGAINLGSQNSQKEEFNKKLYHNELIAKIDSARLVFKKEISDPSSASALDSAFKDILITEEVNDSMDFTMSLFPGEEIGTKVSNKDLFNLAPEELLKKYEVEGFWQRLFTGKFIKITRDGESFARFALSRMSWMAFLMMPLIAFSLKLLYLRRKIYYVEHFVFSMHYHSLAFILFGIVLLIMPYTSPVVPGIAGVVLFVYLFLAMKRFYKQGSVKTFFKLMFLSISYLFIFIFGLLGMLAISLMIY